MSRLYLSLPSFLALMLAVSVPHAARAQPPSSAGINQPVVVTSGEGRVTAAPDRAFVVLTTETRAREPREAQTRNSAAMNAVQEKLRAARVPKEAIRTTAFTLRQEFDYVNGRQVPRDFLARHDIEVRLDDINRVGEIIDAAVASGATSVSQIRFDLQDRPKAEREALRLAVADARARADAAAAGAGTTIDRVIKIEETRSIEPRPPVPMAMEARRTVAEPVTPIAEGELEIRAYVTLTASLR